VVGGPWRGSVSFCGSSVGGLDEDAFFGDPEGYEKEDSEEEHHFPWGPAGEFAGNSSAEDLTRLWIRAPSSTGVLLRIVGGPFTGKSKI
jgi:hypothetical protein